MDREKVNVFDAFRICITEGKCTNTDCPYEYQCELIRNGQSKFIQIPKVLALDVLNRLKEQEAVVHPEPSCEMTYITDCCCDLCGVQLIREDNFCRCCGKPIDWSK